MTKGAREFKFAAIIKITDFVHTGFFIIAQIVVTISAHSTMSRTHQA